MKTKAIAPVPSGSAFTLIEVLVVITIVALLAGLVSSAALGAKRRANAVLAAHCVRSTQLAVRHYEAEYNRLPTPSGIAAQGSIELSAGNGLLPVLLGLGSNPLNPKRIPFLELPQGKVGSYGLVGDIGSLALLDPWGEPIQVLLDVQGEGFLANPDKLNSDTQISEQAPSRLLTRVAVFSTGADRTAHTSDDIVSWRN